MEWLIVVYLVIGIFKTLGRYADPNPERKPLWMITEKNPLSLLFFGLMHALFWPFIKSTN